MDASSKFMKGTHQGVIVPQLVRIAKEKWSFCHQDNLVLPLLVKVTGVVPK